MQINRDNVDDIVCIRLFRRACHPRCDVRLNGQQWSTRNGVVGMAVIDARAKGLRPPMNAEGSEEIRTAGETRRLPLLSR